LDGGFNAWTAAGLEVTRDASPPPKSEWTGKRQQHTIATHRDVRQAIRTTGAVMLDTRSDGEYSGTVVRAKRGGAIPGAVHIEWTRNLAPSGEFKDPDQLRQMYEDAGVTPTAR
jgi:thiosulfate/3-mercaptopyruvate sulfurtransferase